jgi:hypothetical protein
VTEWRCSFCLLLHSSFVCFRLLSHFFLYLLMHHALSQHTRSLPRDSSSSLHLLAAFYNILNLSFHPAAPRAARPVMLLLVL